MAFKNKKVCDKKEFYSLDSYVVGIFLFVTTPSSIIFSRKKYRSFKYYNWFFYLL